MSADDAVKVDEHGCVILDYDLLINSIYMIQADLKVLTEVLAHERRPFVSYETINQVYFVSRFLRSSFTPTQRRH